MPLAPFVRWCLLALLATTFAAPEAFAQGGYRRETIGQIGLTLPVPRTYDAIPVQPTEEWTVMQWRARPGRTDKDFTPETMPRCELIWIPRLPDRAITGESDAPPIPGDEDEEEVPEIELRPINSVEDYFERVLDDSWLLDSPETEKGKAEGYEVTRYALEPGENNRTKWKGWACALRGRDVEVLFLGFCHEDHWKKHTKIWREMARKTEIEEPEKPDVDKLRRYYEKHPEFIDPEYRIARRSELVRGWEADDTENYLYLYSTKDEPLVRTIMSEMESMRAEYERLFPPAAPITAVSTVRICKDKSEYHAYGGPPRSGGYWYDVAKELVFYEYENKKGEGKGSGKKDTRVVLYHEAFHQYIYYSIGELPPHTWYNEGTGDYFSGSVIRGSKVIDIGVNPWRIDAVKYFIEEERTASWQKILRMSKKDFYARGDIYYPQAWSMVYFLRESKDARKNPVWAKILPTYFDVLKDQYQSGIAEAGDALTPDKKSEIGEAAREAALAAAFEGVDYEEITEAWETYTLGLRPPR